MRRNVNIRTTRRDREGACFTFLGATADRAAAAVLVLFAALLFTTTPASAGGPLPPELEFEWARVRAKNNENWTGHWPNLPPIGPPVTVGAVGHNYRIAKTPVTNRQWHEFVVAYAGHFGHPTGQTLQFQGDHIFRLGGTYILEQSAAERPVKIGWRYAAIYTNWLHNGKADTPNAFLSGAYDVSTFGANPDGTLSDQREHSANAKYWLPTRDEWVKAMYYDPNRHGEGQGGYWLHPGMQDTPLFTEIPANGGQTNAGIIDLYPASSPPLHALNVGMYPHVQSPWGALDASGGEEEWLETLHPTDKSRLGRLSNYHNAFSNNAWDHIAHFWAGNMTSYRMGFRVAAIIPAPGGMALVPLTLFLLASRRSRCA